MKVHELKTWPAYYSPLARGEKTFEVRENDSAELSDPDGPATSLIHLGG
ncbi:MAG: DUF3850 domain-containing protein [Sumerlaeia bacterium]